MKEKRSIWCRLGFHTEGEIISEQFENAHHAMIIRCKDCKELYDQRIGGGW